MKLIYAIISRDDTEQVVHTLNKAGFQATKLSSTGGFLKRGNTTLMIGTDDDKLEEVTSLIEKVCGKRETIEVNIPYMSMPGVSPGMPRYYNGGNVKAEVGGAVIFAVDVCFYHKI